MTDKRFDRGPVRLVRRALAPAALEMAGELPGFRDELRGAQEESADLRARLEAEEQAGAELRRRVDELDRRVGELQDGLHESRRLNLRIAELTDLVTEIVLPLHDRDIDPQSLQRLAPDTL